MFDVALYPLYIPIYDSYYISIPYFQWLIVPKSGPERKEWLADPDPGSHNVVPAQALVDVFLAQEGSVQKRLG